MRIALSVLVAFALTLTVHAEDADVLRMYDLTDLFSEIQDDAPPPLGLSSIGSDAFKKTTTVNPKPSENITLDGLLAKYFDPSMTAIIRKHADLRGGSTLFVTGSPTLHAHVEHVLAQARQQNNAQITLSVSLFLMSPQLRQSRYALSGLDWKAIPGKPGQAIAELTAVEFRMMVETLDHDNTGVERVPALPSLPLFAGKLNHSSNITQLAYKPVVFSPKAKTTDIAVINLGDTLSMRVTPTADHLFISLDIHHLHCALQEMKDIDLGAAGKAQEPVLWQGGEHIQRTIAAGHGLMVATNVYLVGNQPRAGFLMVSPNLIELGQNPAKSEKVKKPVAPTTANTAPAKGIGANDF